MKHKAVKNLVYRNSNIPKLAKYDRIKEGLKEINLKKVRNILDLGCGPGQALHALKDINFSGSYLGVDSDSEMIKMANNYFLSRKYESFRFKKCEIQNFRHNKKFDLILIWGVISFFDNYKIFIDKMVNLLNKNGTISLFSGFTENDYNVYVQYKHKDGRNQSGLNMHSLNEIIDYLEKKGFAVNKKKFIPEANLRRKKNPLNSFFLFDNNNNKVLANGLNIIRNFYFIKAKKL